MRHMTPEERLTVKTALREQRERLVALEAVTTDALGRAAFRLRRESVDALIEVFYSGNAILLPFESEGPKVPTAS
jgi:hypothetical protein